MKKIISIITILFATFALYSCFSVTDSLEIISIPKLEFYQNENFPLEDFVKGLKLKVNDRDEFYASTDTTSVSGFDLSQAPGVYTATVSYAAGGVSASATFMYTIRPAKETYGFADYIDVGGINTYIISNVNHFRNIAIGNYEGKNDSTTYFILSNDLDFENTSPWIGFESDIDAYTFTGTLDGNGFSIKNLNTTANLVLNSDNSNTMTTPGLFLKLKDAIFTNLNFDNCLIGTDMTVAKGVGVLGYGIDKNGGSLKVSNLTINSNCIIKGTQNVGALVGYSGYVDVEIKNYVFNGTVISSGSSANAALGSVRSGAATSYKFIDCEINGKIIGLDKVAAFASNSVSETLDILYKNVTISADFYSSVDYKASDGYVEVSWFYVNAESNWKISSVKSIKYENVVVNGTYHIKKLNEGKSLNSAIEKHTPSEKVEGSPILTNAQFIYDLDSMTATLNSSTNLVEITPFSGAAYYIITAAGNYEEYVGGEKTGSSGTFLYKVWKLTPSQLTSTKIHTLTKVYINDNPEENQGWVENGGVATYSIYKNTGGKFNQPTSTTDYDYYYTVVAYNSDGVPVAKTTIYIPKVGGFFEFIKNE